MWRCDERQCDKAGVTTTPRADRRSFDSIVLLPLDTAAHIFSSPIHGAQDSLRLVIRDSARLARFWTRLDTGWSRLPPPPRVDFTTNDVLVASLGPQGYGGPFIAIDTVGIAGDHRWVIVRKEIFRSGCLVGGDYAAPRATDVVVVPRDTVHDTRFVERTALLRNCGDVDDPRPLRRPPH